MNTSDFEQLVRSFADTPDAFQYDAGQFLLQSGGETITARVLQRPAGLQVEEGAGPLPALDWVTTRLARLPQLASQVHQLVSVPKTLVRPSGLLLPRIECAVDESPIEQTDIIKTIESELGQRPAGVTSIHYLTSDGGEGKTTLINCVAREQAAKYLKRETDWLLLPAALGGRPFMRLDDIIVGALSNRFRFGSLHFESLIELVRQGVIVLALDGFEEMFVESSAGDAASSLGSLLKSLRGEGTLLIAARQAYFDFRRLDTQARLFDSIGSNCVTFSKISISRWTKQDFLTYCQMEGLKDGFAAYERLARAMGGEKHPLLTRAVFATKVISILAKEGAALESIVSMAASGTREALAIVAEAILRREAHTVWTQKTDVTQPLLTVAQHRKLLGLVAAEMWATRSEALPASTLELVAQMFCDSFKIPPALTRQVTERIKQHALLSSDGATSHRLRFDHEDFFSLFLGESLASSLLAKFRPDVAMVLRQALLTPVVLDVCVGILVTDHRPQIADALAMLCDAARNDGVASFTRDNAGAIVTRLLPHLESGGVAVDSLAFPEDSLLAKAISGVAFSGCLFRRTSLSESTITDCVFDGCMIEDLELDSDTNLAGSVFEESTTIHEVHLESSIATFDPSGIAAALARRGAKRVVGITPVEAKAPLAAVDDRMKVVDRVIRVFMRSNEINEDVLRQRLGTRAGLFFDAMLSSIADIVIREIPYKGRGTQRRFKLNLPAGALLQAMSDAQGNFEQFLAALRR